MSRQVSRGSAGEYQADEQAGVTRVSCRLSGICAGRCRTAQLAPQVLFLGQEDPLEKGMAAHSSILAWTIPCREEPGGLLSMGSQESDMTW